MLRVNEKTGEVSVSPFSKFRHATVGRKTGSMIVQNYGFKYDEKLRKEVLVPTDKVDMQAYIDSFADECDIYSILKQYAKTGDVSLLNKRQGVYADISGLNGDALDPVSHLKKASKSVAKLSKELGVKFTAEQLMTMSSDELASLIKKAAAAKALKEEVKAPEIEVKKEGE